MGSGKTAQHTYTTAATYTATLQVTDNLGASAILGVSIAVARAAAASVGLPL